MGVALPWSSSSVVRHFMGGVPRTNAYEFEKLCLVYAVEGYFSNSRLYVRHNDRVVGFVIPLMALSGVSSLLAWCEGIFKKINDEMVKS